MATTSKKDAVKTAESVRPAARRPPECRPTSRAPSLLLPFLQRANSAAAAAFLAEVARPLGLDLAVRRDVPRATQPFGHREQQQQKQPRCRAVARGRSDLSFYLTHTHSLAFSRSRFLFTPRALRQICAGSRIPAQALCQHTCGNPLLKPRRSLRISDLNSFQQSDDCVRSPSSGELDRSLVLNMILVQQWGPLNINVLPKVLRLGGSYRPVGALRNQRQYGSRVATVKTGGRIAALMQRRPALCVRGIDVDAGACQQPQDEIEPLFLRVECRQHQGRHARS